MVTTDETLADIAAAESPKELDAGAAGADLNIARAGAGVDEVPLVARSRRRRSISAGVMFNRAFVVRALLRAAPDASTFAPLVKRYLAEFPARPRGWAARKARQHGQS